MEAAPEPDVAVYRDVIAIGASAGGIEPLTELVADLPSGFPAALLVVVHLLPKGPSRLAPILDRRGELGASAARHGEPIEPGHIYVAPPDCHLLMSEGAVLLSDAPPENGHRPAIDPLFRSVAHDAGPRAIGVVLSGSQDDGAAGLSLLKQQGGATVVQDPEEALYPSMPLRACAATEIDRVVPVGEMAAVLAGMVVGENVGTGG